MVGGLAPPTQAEEEEQAQQTQQSVIFVLEGAQLETAQVGKVRSPPIYLAEILAVMPGMFMWPVVAWRRECKQNLMLAMLTCLSQTYQLLNCDDHATFLSKHKKDPALYRPDIAHQVSTVSEHWHLCCAQLQCYA